MSASSVVNATALLLGLFPWVLLITTLPWSRRAWSLWMVAVAAHAVWMCWRAPRSRIVPAASLAAILGFLCIQLVLVWQKIVSEDLVKDYFNYMTLISLAAQDFFARPPNLAPALQIPYLQYSFDPVVPLLTRIIPLTASPFYLLGFQTLALFAPAFVLWALAVRDATLRPFQFFLPALYILLPAVPYTAQGDYHTSGIGISLLLLGTVLVFTRTSQAWLLLLIGTLTKVSYWPSFLMFSAVSLLYRRRRAAALFAATFVAAMALYEHLQTVPSYSLGQFFGYLGASPFEMLQTLLTHPDVVLAQVAQPAKWLYLLRLLLPLGFGPLLFPPALLPTLPLIAMSLLDSTGYRSLTFSEYALEYTPFLFAAELIVLKLAPPSRRIVLVVLATVGTLASLVLYESAPGYYTVFYPYWSPPTVASLQVAMPQYNRQVQFVNCAMGDDTVLATIYKWVTFLRRDYDHVWVDDGFLYVHPTPEEWDHFGLLVFSTDPTTRGNVLTFPFVQQNAVGYDAANYAALRSRLPILVQTPNYFYAGGDQLAACAQQFGFPIVAGQ